MQRLKSTKINVFFGISFVIINLVKNIVLVPFYLYFIDINEYGAWLATGGILAQLFVTDFGLSTLMIQKSARYYNNDNSKLGTTIAGGFLLSMLIVVSISLMLLYVASLITGLVVDDDRLQITVSECLQLAILANAISIFAITFNGLQKSFLHSVKAGVIELFSEFIGICAIVIMFMSGFGLYSLPLALLIRAVVLLALSASVFLWIAAQLSIQFSMPGMAVLSSLFRDSSHLLLNTITMRVSRRADVFFVGVFLGAEQAGVYSISIRAFETVNIFLSQFGKAAIPSISNLFGSNALHRLKDVSMKYFMLLTVMGLVFYSGVVLFNSTFVKLWVGDQYFAGQIFVVLAGIAFFIQTAASVAYDFLLAKGEYRFISRSFLCVCIVYLILVNTLLPFGLYLAPLIQVITGILVLTLLSGKFMHQVQIKIKELRPVFSVLVSGAIPLLGFYMISSDIRYQLEDWPMFIVSTFSYVLVMFGSLYIMNRSTTNKLIKELVR